MYEKPELTLVDSVANVVLGPIIGCDDTETGPWNYQSDCCSGSTTSRIPMLIDGNHIERR